MEQTSKEKKIKEMCKESDSYNFPHTKSSYSVQDIKETKRKCYYEIMDYNIKRRNEIILEIGYDRGIIYNSSLCRSRNEI